MTEPWYIWVPDPEWHVEEGGGKCRARDCTNTPVAFLYRLHRYKRGGRVQVAWRYCEDHLFGRRVENGKVWIKVHRESPMGRGYLKRLRHD